MPERPEQPPKNVRFVHSDMNAGRTQVDGMCKTVRIVMQRARVERFAERHALADHRIKDLIHLVLTLHERTDLTIFVRHSA